MSESPRYRAAKAEGWEAVAGLTPGEKQPVYLRAMEAMLSSIKDFAYVFDRDGRFLYVNQPLLNLWGLTLDQAVGKNFYDLKYPDDLAERLQRQIQLVIDTRQELVDETPYESPSGKPGYYEYIFTPVLAADGHVEAVAGSTRDITSRKRLELEREQFLLDLKAERANLAAVVEHAPAFVCVFKGPLHTFDLANEQYYKLIGRRDILGKTIRKALPEIEGQGFFELLDTVYQTGEPFAGNEMPVMLGPLDATEIRFVNFVYQALRGADGAVTGVFVHGVDVTDMVRSREDLREREARFQQLADAMPQIVWSATPDGVLNYYNRRWFEYIKVPEDAGDEAAWDRYVHPDDLPSVLAQWASSLGSGESYNQEFRVRNGAGEYRWFLVRALPIRADDGTIVRWFGTCTDIEDRRRAEAEREQLLTSERSARSEAERASLLKDEFLATLSHELRTPLNAVLGWAQILRSNPSANADEVRQGLETIERNARAQTQIIEDLLDMSRIISGKVRLDLQRVDLASVVQAAVETTRPTAEAKGVRVQAVLDPLGAPVSGDPNRLQQVFWNLLTNAVKFTPRGGQIQVTVNRGKTHLQVSVIDTGEGIAPEFLPYVFDRFRQADSSTARRYGGLGLGLSIVKQLVELHGGTIRATSDGIGKGASFTVELPLADVSEEPKPGSHRTRLASPALAPASEICAGIAGVRVLVVDDEADSRELVKRLLEACSASVTIAASADEAVERVNSGRFDVIISDIGMPGTDGYTLIRRLRALDKSAGGETPAIALTAYARAEDRLKAVVAGFQRHIPKPVEPAELIAMVASLMRDVDSQP